jgi:hypothetical protein
MYFLLPSHQTGTHIRGLEVWLALQAQSPKKGREGREGGRKNIREK